MADDFGWLNPHLSLSLDWKDAKRFAHKASDPAWTKWQPQDPTSAHWYDPPRLRRLIGAYIARDEDCGREPRTVREFIIEFRGLSGSAKQKAILDEIGGARMSLPDLFGSGDDVNMAAITKLLEAMKRQSRPVKSKDLGVIGRDHFAAKFGTAGADLRSFKYKHNFGADDMPDVIETAFGWRPRGKHRRIITGINWSPAIGNPFRSLGYFGESLDHVLAMQRSGPDEPVTFVLHLARPRIEYTDHGKTAVSFARGDDQDRGGDE